MLDFRDSGQEAEAYEFDLDFSEKLLWPWSTDRMLYFRESSQETGNDYFGKEFKEFAVVFKHWTNTGL